MGEFLRQFGNWLAVYCFVFGGAVLVVKILFPGLWPQVLLLGAAVIPLAIAAWWMTPRSGQGREATVAWLDRRIHAGGLLMALNEIPDPAWSSRLPGSEQAWNETLPRIRPVRFFQSLVLPVLFAIGACFVPLREARTESILENTVGRQASEQLQELLTQLDEASILEEEEKQELQEEIEKLAEESKKTPLTHEKWETVDALRQKMLYRLDTKSMAVDKARSAVAGLMKPADGGDQILNEQRSGQLTDDLQSALQELAKSGELANASPDLRDALEKMMQNGQLTLPQESAARQKALENLQQFLDQESQKLSELRSESQNGLCQHCGSPLHNGECVNSNCPGNQHGGQQSSERPGKGGVTRGRGDAPMSWGDESDETTAKFKEVVLPPGAFDQPKDEVYGTTKSTPEADPAATAGRNTARTVDAASGSETWTRKIRPRHRNVVRRYFDSE